MKLKKLRKNIASISWMMPATILVVLVTFYPLFYAFFLSFHQTSFLQIRKFIGFDNYLGLFKDTSTVNSIFRSLIFVFSSVFLSVIIGFILALILDQEFIGRGLIRTIIIAPWVIAEVTTAVIWSWFLNPNLSPIVYVTEMLGLGKIKFLSNSILAMISIILVSVWRFYPFPLILILAALQMVPRELYEAAKVDGASMWQSVKSITIPLVKNTVAITTILSSLFYFNKITLPWVLTGGGPGEATNLLTLLLYRKAFHNWQIGYAATISIFIFLINLIVSLAYFKCLRAEAYY